MAPSWVEFTDDVRLGYFDRRRGFLERSFLNEENAQPGVGLILDYPLDERLMVHGRQAEVMRRGRNGLDD